jgi:hypothetical protein
MRKRQKLGKLARILRSKNAGIHHLTFDIIFDNPETYNKVRQSGAINKELFCRLYGITEKEITDFIEFDAGNAFKITILRPHVSGNVGIGETDVFGSGQYLPLQDVEVPL